jgi:hypothetical protein
VSGHDVTSHVHSRVNERIRELAGSAADDEARLFLCECGDPLCVEEVALTIREFDLRRGLNGGHILAHVA